MRKILLYTFALSVGVSLGVSAQKKKQKVTAPVSMGIEATTAAQRMTGYQQRQKLDAASLVNNVKFRAVGPTNMSGRVVDLDVNDANPTHFFVAYASGGLWKTENNGMSFAPLFDNESTMTIGDIAVDWKTNGQTIWVGTGENNSSRSSYAGDGIYKSTDGGKTWQHLGLAATHHIGKVILHPTDPIPYGWRPWEACTVQTPSGACTKQPTEVKPGPKRYLWIITPEPLTWIFT